jgi:hypothetical protein
VTFHYTDPDGHEIETTPETHWHNEPVVTIWARGEYATIPVRIPVDRIEELVAGLRDTARQAAAQEQQAVWRRSGGFDQHDDYRETIP